MRGVKSPAAGLRFHDLRHTAISALAKAAVPDRVIMDLAGHVSLRMLRRYSHIQLEAKRATIRALSNLPLNVSPGAVAGEANVGKHVTESAETGKPEGVPAENIESIGRPKRTRTIDLYRVNVRGVRRCIATDRHQACCS